MVPVDLRPDSGSVREWIWVMAIAYVCLGTGEGPSRIRGCIRDCTRRPCDSLSLFVAPTRSSLRTHRGRKADQEQPSDNAALCHQSKSTGCRLREAAAIEARGGERSA